MQRRALLLASGAWLAAAAARSFAQPAKTLRRIAVLFPGTEAGFRSRLDAFRTGLRNLGYVEGRDVSIDVRWSSDRTEQLGTLAAEIVSHNPAVILTSSSAAVRALQKATSTIPIVFGASGDPVFYGLVKSLARPGGNVTGITVLTGLTQKLVELTRQALPNARRLAFPVHERDPAHKRSLDEFGPAARKLDFDPLLVPFADAGDLGLAFRELAERKADVLLVPVLAFFTSQMNQLVERALKARLPIVSTQPTYAEAGALLSYGTQVEGSFQRAAALVDKILRGAKPADLPVEEPERIQLIVNMKTARAIGVTLSPVTMLRADKVIE